MPQLRSSREVDVSSFLEDGLAVKQHLSRYLELSLEQVEQRLPSSTDDLADLHPGAFRPEDATTFYEDTVGTGHLLELAAWHLSSADYIADTLRLQRQFAARDVLAFGGGIGAHDHLGALPGRCEGRWRGGLGGASRCGAHLGGLLVRLAVIVQGQADAGHRALDAGGVFFGREGVQRLHGGQFPVTSSVACPIWIRLFLSACKLIPEITRLRRNKPGSMVFSFRILATAAMCSC